MKKPRQTKNPDASAAKPFVKWAGGKTQLLPQLHEALTGKISMSERFIYVEPFCGGASLFFSLVRDYGFTGKAILNDINAPLMETFRTVRDAAGTLIAALKEIEHEFLALDSDAQKEFFLARREEFNSGACTKLRSATLLIFLNKTCFNGLFRVNSKGKFNTPFGRYRNPKICDEQTLLADSAALKNVELCCGDFVKTLPAAEALRSRGEKILFYIDPPYKPLSATSSFTAYAQGRFDDDDQLRIFRFCKELDARKIYWLQSNSDAQTNDETPRSFFGDIYTASVIRRVPAKRAINAVGSRRGNINEVLISNF